MKRTINLCIGLIVGLLFMIVPLNFGVYGFVIDYIQPFFNFIGTISVIIFGLHLLIDAFTNLKKIEIKDNNL